MTLRYITCTVCPFCNNDEMRLEERRDQHLNGQWNERRTFNCGYDVSWSPNFERLVVNQPCRSDPEEVNKRNHRVQLMDELRATVSAADVDRKFKDEALFLINEHLACVR